MQANNKDNNKKGRKKDRENNNRFEFKIKQNKTIHILVETGLNSYFCRICAKLLRGVGTKMSKR